MQPYQEAADVTRNSGQIPVNALKFAGAAALGSAGPKSFSNLLPRVLALLNNVIPESFSKQGLNKINGKFGEFINAAENHGYGFNEIRDFLNQKAKSDQQKQANEHRSVIEQYSPELFQYLKDHIARGETPIQAAGFAQYDDKFKNIVKKIMKDHKTPWSSIVESAFGTGEIPQQQPQEQMQQPGQSENLDQAMMAAFEKILQM